MIVAKCRVGWKGKKRTWEESFRVADKEHAAEAVQAQLDEYLAGAKMVAAVNEVVQEKELREIIVLDEQHPHDWHQQDGEGPPWQYQCSYCKKKRTSDKPPAEFLQGGCAKRAAIESAAEASTEVVPACEEDTKGMTEAEQWGLLVKHGIENMRTGAEYCLLEIGRMLVHVRKEGIWSTMHFESMKDFILDLEFPTDVSYSWASRMMGVHEHIVVKTGLTSQQLARIGVAKLFRLLPAARRGDLTDELLQMALDSSISERKLAQIISGIEEATDPASRDTSIFFRCPNCGKENQILHAKWLSGHEVPSESE